MKTIKKDELFRNLSRFLKTKGVELKDGVYAQRINRACDLLTEAITATQKTARHAKVEVDKKLHQVRQSIHEATAPKPPPASATKPASASAPTKKARPSRKPSAAPSKRHRKA